MSSPSDSLTDIDESALNKKRGRAQSVEPASQQEVEDELNPTEEASTIVSAPKKTKRDDEDSPATVNTIRKNMKDMSTTDKSLTESSDDEAMGTIAEEEEKTANSLAKFGGGKDDEDDWGEFAEEEEEEKPAKAEETDKPKYTFGASSGFGTKGWGASHQTIPTPSKQPTFGGFGSSSGFGGFKSSSTTTNDTTKMDNTSTSTITNTTTSTSVPSFGSFAKATTSPFATAATGNALALPHSPATSSASTDLENNSTNGGSNNNNKDSELNESDNESNTDTPTAFGESARVKVPGIKQQTEVTTGEENEKTIYQTKAKLLVLDAVSGSWKERGAGTVRINQKEEDEKLQTRLVMRTDSVYRVILNLLLFEGMKVFIMQDKFVRFAGFEKQDDSAEPKLVSYALRLSNPSIANDLCEEIMSCIPTSS